MRTLENFSYCMISSHRYHKVLVSALDNFFLLVPTTMLSNTRLLRATSSTQQAHFSNIFFPFFSLLRSLSRVYMHESERARVKKWREKAFVEGTSNQALWLIEGSYFFMLRTYWWWWWLWEEKEEKLRNFLCFLLVLSIDVF